MVLCQNVCGFGKEDLTGSRGVTVLIGGVDRSVHDRCEFRIHHRRLQFDLF
jgi:hypothetical protein